MSWWRKPVPAASAAGLVGAVTMSSCAGIEVVRAWTSAPHAAAEAGHVVGGMLVALLVVAAFAFATRSTSLAGVVVAAAFALCAHGGTLVLQGETIGALSLGLAPVVGMLASIAFSPGTLREHNAALNAKMLGLWMKTRRPRKTAHAAAPVASRIPLAMRASQATIIDA